MDVVPSDPVAALLAEARRLHACGAGDDDVHAAYLAVLQRDPTRLDALLEFGRALMAAGRRAAARVAFSQAVEHHPDVAAAQVMLGLAQLESGEPGPARERFECALRIDPGDALAHTGLSFCLEQLGESEAAAGHRRLGFAGRALIRKAYRGTGTAVPILLLASANGGNVPLERHLDERVFETTIVVPEFLDAGTPLPPHRLVVNAIGDVDAVPDALRAARAFCERTAQPILNVPSAVAATGRCDAVRRYGDIPGVVVPRAVLLPRAALSDGAAAEALRSAGLAYPLLMRSPGHHTGMHFERIDGPAALAPALQRLPGDALIAIEYVETRSPDGRWRKYRAMTIAGRLLPLHLAVSGQWKVHYFSAAMADSQEYRAEEARFLEAMPEVLGADAMRALAAIQRRMGLDYGGIDFAIGSGGEVVLFEANATMIVAPADADPRWDYRRAAVARVDEAVRAMLLRRADLEPRAATVGHAILAVDGVAPARTAEGVAG